MNENQRAGNTGIILQTVLPEHQGMVSGLAWEPHGHVLASTAFDKTLRIWDINSGKNLKTAKKHSRNITALTWAPEGQALASAGDDRNIIFWAYPSTEVIESISNGEKGINALAWSPNGKMLVVASNSLELSVWDTKTRQMVQQVRGHERMARHLAFSKRGETLASTSDSNRIRVWKSVGFSPWKLLEGHRETVNMTAWTPDDRLISCSDDSTIRVWDVGKNRCLHVLKGHEGPVKAISLSADGRLMASKSWDQTLRIWRCDTWQNVFSLEEEYVSPYPLLSFNPKEPLLASVGLSGQVIRIWQVSVDFLSVADPDERIFSFQSQELQLLREKKNTGLVSPESETETKNSTLNGVSCPHCHKLVPEREVVRWQSHGYTSVKCPGCSGLVPLVSDTSLLSLREWASGEHVELAILFSDIVDSTHIGNELGDEEMGQVRRAHFEKARDFISRFEGYEVKTIGDSFMVAFKDSVSAFLFALAFRIDTGHSAVQVRIGFHFGIVDIEENDAFGATVNLSARIQSKAGSSEIWVSQKVKQQLETAGSFINQAWLKHEEVELKGFDEKFTLWST